MPFKSKSQMRKFFAMESSGEIPKGTTKEWLKETPNVKKLPEKLVKKSFAIGFEKAAAGFSYAVPKFAPKALAPKAPSFFYPKNTANRAMGTAHDIVNKGLDAYNAKVRAKMMGGVTAPIAKTAATAAPSPKFYPKTFSSPGKVPQVKGMIDRALDAYNKKIAAKKAINSKYVMAKIALVMSDEAALQTVNMADRIPGTELRDTAETGQARGRATRTFNVKNEDRQFGKKFRRSADTARGGQNNDDKE